MKVIKIPTTRGIKNEVVYNIDDFPYSDLHSAPKCKRKKMTYYNISASFDIETTSIEPQMIGDKYITRPYGFMYQWQFCVNDNVVFGRTWEEYRIFLDRIREFMALTENRKLVVYVHNLAFEFQFMK